MSPTDPRRGTAVILTGAGISAESGVATFRDPEGIWARHDPDDVATPEAYRRDPEAVHEFYNQRRRDLRSAGIAPNRAHEALARLEREWPAEVLIVTQNVDDLHERAGARNVLHMHGELLSARCVRCGRSHPWKDDLGIGTIAPCCGAPGCLRPDVVWFGEMPIGLERIEAALRRCALFAAIGTSGSVWPAAGFIETIRRHTMARSYEINLEETPASPLFDGTILGPAGRTVPDWVDRLLQP